MKDNNIYVECDNLKEFVSIQKHFFKFGYCWGDNLEQDILDNVKIKNKLYILYDIDTKIIYTWIDDIDKEFFINKIIKAKQILRKNKLNKLYD